MPDTNVGLSDIEIYIPHPYIGLSKIVEERGKVNPKLKRYLDRAVLTTGQTGLRFPEVWEDPATLAATAAGRLLRNNGKFALPYLRYITVGTETSVDHSKPIAAHVEGMLQKSGLRIPTSISTFQVQHACAGGSLALLSVSGLLHFSPIQQEMGVVVCSDVAHYRTETTAEITQGAGAIALLVTKNPRLLELDIGTQGYSSRDVDDFFRPLGSTTAVVRGGYSMKCYEDALDDAVMDHSRRLRLKPDELLDSSDIIVLHTPFRNMPLMGMKRLLDHWFDMDETAATKFLEDRGFSSGVDPVAEIGNIYTGSIYLTLAFSLEARYRELGDDIIGKRVLMASYGSGNTMVVFSGTIPPSAPEVIKRWNLSETVFETKREASILEYCGWTGSPFAREKYAEIMRGKNIPEGSYYLKEIREDGYHEYAYKS